MHTKKAVFVFLVVFAVFGFNSLAGAADADPWFVEDIKGDQAILEPGTTTYCNKDFKVENMSDQEAEVQIILGNGAKYAHEMLEPKASKSFKLGGGYEMAEGWHAPESIHVDDARIVNVTGGTSELKVHCK